MPNSASRYLEILFMLKMQQRITPLFDIIIFLEQSIGGAHYNYAKCDNCDMTQYIAPNHVNMVLGQRKSSQVQNKNTDETRKEKEQQKKHFELGICDGIYRHTTDTDDNSYPFNRICSANFQNKSCLPSMMAYGQNDALNVTLFLYSLILL